MARQLPPDMWKRILDHTLPSARRHRALRDIYLCMCVPYVEIDHRPDNGIRLRMGLVRWLCPQWYAVYGHDTIEGMVRRCSARARGHHSRQEGVTPKWHTSSPTPPISSPL